jgi:Amt family ammonium transporter
MMCGFLVFFMQCGFALLEAGTVRAKNTKNILLKNLLDACVGAIIWWGWGYSLAYDAGDPFIGMVETTDVAPMFFMSSWKSDTPMGSATAYGLALWFFQYVFAAAAATIVSGAMAERTALGGYITYTTVITGFIYPVVVHWGWSSDGWASAFATGSVGNPDGAFKTGMVDFAGSGIVHTTGGVAALCGAAVVGPRTGRFDDAKKPISMPGHSTTLQVMGTFILWLGWYGFNPGSTLGIANPAYAAGAARCVVTTTLSAAAGGIMVILLEKIVGDHTWSVGAACNGILAGLVSITAGTSVMLPGLAFLTGCLGGIVYFSASKIVLNVCKVDDPLDAFAVHGSCGFWGVTAAALFADKNLGYASCSGGGLFMGGGGDGLAVAMSFLFATIGFVGTLSFLMFFLLKKIGILRVSAEVEAAGMDVSKHGGSAYEGGDARA